MILLYHGVIPDDSPPEWSCVGQALSLSAFERHMRWLAAHYPIVSLAEYVSDMKKASFAKRQPIAITFDDGYAIMFQCIFPLLTEMNIPATIFVATGHLENGELLWFNYLKALCFENLYKSIQVNQSTFQLQTIEQRKQAWNELRRLAKSSGAPAHFVKTLIAKYPLTPNVFALYAGMTYEQIKIASKSNLLQLGSHTITHPYLDQISREEQEKEILGSQSALAEITGKPPRYFAYPSGDYNHATVEVVKAAGYEASFAVIPKKIETDPRFEIERIGIYSQSLLKLQIKALGLVSLARQIGLRFG